MKNRRSLALAGLAAGAMIMTGGFSSIQASAAETQTAIFAGGCFWCVESDFDHVKGVVSTTSGYVGGDSQNPTYQNHEGFLEGEKIEFDPSQVSYAELVNIFFHSIDPTDDGGQFCDRGPSYTTAIFAEDQQQKQAAEKAKAAAEQQLGKPIVTPIRGDKKFWPAEGYHQDYYKKNPLKYKFYRTGCGRNARVKEVWGDKAYVGIKGAES